MKDAIVVINAGSSSIKFCVFVEHSDDCTLVARGQIEAIYTSPRFVAKDATGRPLREKRWESGERLGHERALEHILEWLKSTYGREYGLLAMGHRVVHGGTDFAAPARVDETVLAKLEKLVPLAPLHQPHNLTPIRTMLERAPSLPQVACFDTAMHRTQPVLAQMFALPKELDDAGVRRYGFHGLSYEYIASALPDVDELAARGRTVVLHLGNGASMCALDGGRSIATTMGFTAVEGLPMGTRTGSLDPGVLLYLLEQGMDARALEELIYGKSGLLGISGISSDMRVLLESSEPRAKLAVDYFVYRIGRELGSLTAALGGIDAIVFTAGIGENSPVVRERVGQQASWLGVEMDAAANSRGGPRVSTSSSRIPAWVIPTNEELMIARHTRQLLARG
jgi:acetate kinase